MTVKRLRRAVAAGVLVGVLAMPVAEAAPAAHFAAPDLWAQAWEWVASWWNAWGGDVRPSGEKQIGTSDPTGLPLNPTGSTTTTTPPTTGGGGEVGGHIDPNG